MGCNSFEKIYFKESGSNINMYAFLETGLKEIIFEKEPAELGLTDLSLDGVNSLNLIFFCMVNGSFEGIEEFGISLTEEEQNEIGDAADEVYGSFVPDPSIGEDDYEALYAALGAHIKNYTISHSDKQYIKVTGAPISVSVPTDWTLQQEADTLGMWYGAYIGEDSHIHQFDATTWKFDATHHWHECTVDECDYKVSYGEHDGDECSICGKTAHTHNWKYTVGTGADANKITAKCEGDGDCDVTNGKTTGVSLTLTASSANYSGNPVTATLTDPENKWHDNVNETLPTIIYYTNEDCSEAHRTTVGIAGDSTSGATTDGGAPKNIGNYWAAITGGTGDNKATAKVEFRITSPGGSGGGGGYSPSPSPSPAPSTPAPTEQYTIPVKGDDTVQIGAAITEGNAVVSEITTESLDKALNDNTQSGDKVATKVTIDLSGANQEVTGVTLTKTSVDALVKTVEDTSNQVEKVEIKLSNAVVVMDSKALEAISEQAEGDDIRLVVDDTQQNKLAAPQKEALKTYNVSTTFEAYIECNGSRIHDFKGGNVTVNVAFKAEAGRDQKFYHVFYVADNGKMTQYKTRFVDGMMQFTTTHFSDYAIIYDDTQENETGKEPEQESTELAKPSKTIAMNAGLKVNQTGNGINVKWGKVTGTDGYFVYASYCGQPMKKIKTIKSVDTTSYKITKLDGKSLNLKKNYKVLIAAYKVKDGKKVTLAKSIAAHVVGQQNTKNTNAKGIKLAKSKYTLAVGKTATIKATTILVDKKQLGDEHAKEFRYASSDKSVATVTSTGKMKAKKAGKCTIYVYARNGYAKKITVTVK